MPSRTPVEKVYGERFFCRRHKLHWRAVPLCDALTRMWKFNSVVDVGCATGDIVKEFEDRGLFACGIEGSKAAENYIVCNRYIIADLRTLGNFRGMKNKYELCLCLEVAEHIEEEYADVFVENLVNLSDRIVLSAAPPGQGGHGHVNCQPPSYWINKFKPHGYDKNLIATDLFKYFIEPWKNKPGIKAYYGNTMVLEKGLYDESPT